MLHSGVPAGTQPDGYQNFGSFFTDSVQVMIHDAEWMDPPLPALVASVRRGVRTVGGDRTLGECRRDDFHIDFAAYSFVNHGAFGACLRSCYAETRAWQDHCEAQPLRFLDRELFPHMVRLLRNMARFVRCSPTDLAFLPNATTGLNTVMASVPLNAGDEVLMLDIGYGALKTIAESHCARAGAALIQAHVALPVRGEAEIETSLLQRLTDKTRLVILDSVTSNTGIVLPVQEVIRACRARFPDVLVLVDAAHALGQLDVNIPDTGADFWVGNCHKWLCGPRGTAIMWVRPDQQHLVRPLVISHGHGHGFTSDFIWDGCRDYGPYLGVDSALNWWNALDGDAIRHYMRSLLSEAVTCLTERWQSSTVAPLSMCASMACVQLPAALQVGDAEATSSHAKRIQEALYASGVEAPIKCLHGHLFCRISVHVYNVLEDFHALDAAVQSMAL